MKYSWCLLQSLAAAPRPGEAQSEAPSLQPGIFKPEATVLSFLQRKKNLLLYIYQ